MSVSTVGSISIRSTSLASFKKTPQIKENDIFLNGKKVKFSKDFAKTARGINRLSKLGIKAEIVTSKDGKERLILRVKSGVLDIKDPKNVLATLYKQGQIGKTKDKTIQIVRSGRGFVNLKYSAGPIKAPLVKGLRLKPAHIIHFAEKRRRYLPVQPAMQEVERGVLPEVRENQEIPEVRLEEVAVQLHNVPFGEDPLSVSIDQEKMVQSYINRALRQQRIRESLQAELRVNSELNADSVVEALRKKMGSISDLESKWIKDIISIELIQSDLDATFLRKRINQISDVIYQNIHSKRSVFNKVFSNLGLSREQIRQATQETIVLLKIEQEKSGYI